MRPTMRQPLIRPMMIRPANGAQQPQIRPQTRSKPAPRTTTTTVDDDDDVVWDDDSNDEWLPSGAGAAPAGGMGQSASGGLPSFANTWR